MSIVVVPRFDFVKFLESMKRHKATHILYVFTKFHPFKWSLSYRFLNVEPFLPWSCYSARFDDFNPPLCASSLIYLRTLLELLYSTRRERIMTLVMFACCSPVLLRFPRH